MMSGLINRFLNTHNVFTCTRFLSMYQSGLTPDKLYVNHLKLPGFLNFHGPTGEEIVKDLDLSKKTCLITGGTSGIGAEIVRCLLKKHCNVVMACRNRYAARIAARTIWEDPQNFETYDIDLASLASVKKCSENILETQKKIDIVILNAAVFGLPWTLTEDKLETIFQINFLSQFYLLTNIEKILAPGARVVFMSSESHRNVKWNLMNTASPQEELLSIPKEIYTSIKAYNLSKLCGILAMHYLGYRWSEKQCSVFCAHPGSFIKTKLSANWWLYDLMYTAMQPFSKSIAQGASTPLYCATAPELEGASRQYFKNCRKCTESDLARDVTIAFRIIDLVQSILRDRIGLEDDFTQKAEGIQREPLIVQAKSQMEEPVLST